MHTTCHQFESLRQCVNPFCEEWDPVVMGDFRRAVPKWSVDAETGLCARCIYDREVERLLRLSTAVETALDTFEQGGAERVEQQIDRRGFVDAFAAVAAELAVDATSTSTRPGKKIA